MLSQDTLDALFEQIKSSRGVLNSEQARSLCDDLNYDFDKLTHALLPLAAKFACPPISRFYVGAIAVEKTGPNSGNLYFGANLEFAHQALSLVVHAEQAAINNAWLNGAKQIDKMVITDAPCGYCRQFMNELYGAQDLEIVLPKTNTTLPELLPNAFGPLDLNNPHSVFNSQPVALAVNEAVSDALVAVASCSYAPYSNNYSAVEIVTDQGRFYGGYIENAAYSPSLSPLQGALSQMILGGSAIEDTQIIQVTLLETRGQSNQLGVVRAVLDSLGRDVELKHILADIKQ